MPDKLTNNIVTEYVNNDTLSTLNDESYLQQANVITKHVVIESPNAKVTSDDEDVAITITNSINPTKRQEEYNDFKVTFNTANVVIIENDIKTTTEHIVIGWFTTDNPPDTIIYWDNNGSVLEGELQELTKMNIPGLICYPTEKIRLDGGNYKNCGRPKGDKYNVEFSIHVLFAYRQDKEYMDTASGTGSGDSSTGSGDGDGSSRPTIKQDNNWYLGKHTKKYSFTIYRSYIADTIAYFVEYLKGGNTDEEGLSVISSPNGNLSYVRHRVSVNGEDYTKQNIDEFKKAKRKELQELNMD
jgi:hypothetical protein